MDGISSPPSDINGNCILDLFEAFLLINDNENWNCCDYDEINCSQSDQDIYDCVYNNQGCCENLEPCDQIKAQNENPDFKEKVDILKNSFNKKYEAGFKERNGGFINLDPFTRADGGHSMKLGSLDNVKGYIHTHPNSYTIPDRNGDGIDETRVSVHMLTLQDVISFLQIVKNTQQPNSNITQEEVYGSMYSSSGNYTIKFTGDINDVNNLVISYNDNYKAKKKVLDEKFRSYIKKYNSKEKAFLLFIKQEKGLEGIELYKLKNNGTIKRKELDLNNKIKSTEC